MEKTRRTDGHQNTSKHTGTQIQASNVGTAMSFSPQGGLTKKNFKKNVVQEEKADKKHFLFFSNNIYQLH